ncbi:hypothetical protein BDQ17DRAFT_1249132 [Cyathus striatus]|nr:hypothetical protein BDQ17DRAFT_1268156 [Cyathus striatus]KAF8980451.1 hypothetical protein BDQ17DRAFT_1263797 [Cyathus striatus]KAF8997020.1 hypothetical protein BDQ17DRAFT_1249132 [Cyathus striatus]
MFIHNSISYNPTTPEGLEAYKHLLPSGGHIVHVYGNDMLSQRDASAEAEVYTIALFHRLRCLEVISKQYARIELQSSPLTTHCMNYLRQSILCRLNLRLESVMSQQGKVEKGGYDTKCKDWSAVYEEAERNHNQNLVFK